MPDPSSYLPSLVTTAALAVACASLSVFVVARRWAFIGEGISHSGFGGAGTAWLAMLVFPSLDNRPEVLAAGVVLGCLGTAVAIGTLTRGTRVTGDAAIGIFLVASLAWGVLAGEVYRHARHGALPPAFDALLFGQRQALTAAAAVAAMAVSAAVVLTLAALGKEVVAYCLDPVMAQASGVRTGVVHYVLMVLLALVIIVGMPVTGSVLVTALLVLPGATAALLSRRLATVMGIAVCVALVAALAGVACGARWRFLPAGPLIVLGLFAEFVAAYAYAKLRRRRA